MSEEPIRVFERVFTDLGTRIRQFVVVPERQSVGTR